jgi:GNAT superfamily N-acetyltransferase
VSEIEISDAAVDDAREILFVQKAAYAIEARRYDIPDIPPMTQRVEDLILQFGDHAILKATEYGDIVGSVRAFFEDGTCFIGRLCVLPENQRRGIGTLLMQEIESRFPYAERFELFTGDMSEDNLRLYARLGYVEYKRERTEDGVTLVYLEKRPDEGSDQP